MANTVPWALRGMTEPFDDLQFALSCLNLSYAGETRVEASSKVPKLFDAEKEFYLKVYPGFLKKLPKMKKMLKKGSENGMHTPGGRKFSMWLRKTRFKWFLKKSRIRGILRWPKFLVTVDEWIDIIFAKIERTKGIKLHATERQRRHPLIFGWPYLFRLIRAGAIKSTKEPPDKDKLNT